MTYRDEGEAVRSRAEALEEKLHEAEREIARLKDGGPVPEAPASKRASTWSWLSTVIVLVVLGAGILALVVGFIQAIIETRQERANDATFTRRATATFAVTSAHAEGVYVPADASCRVVAELEGNGSARRVREIVATCGLLTWRTELVRGKGCVVHEHEEGPRRFSYSLDCDVPVGSPSKTKLGNPGLRVARGTYELYHPTMPMVVRLSLGPQSPAVEGERLASP